MVRIGIWHWTEQAFNGEIVREEPRGGTETAVAYTCEALAAQGNEVVVYCNTPAEEVVRGVDYRRAHNLRERIAPEVFDAFGVVRHLAAFTIPVTTRALFYWCHDNLEQPFTHGAFRFFEDKTRRDSLVGALSLAELDGQIDRVFAVSHWQAEALQARFAWEHTRACVVGNGLQPGLFDTTLDCTSRRPILLYSLTPDRGLRSLLEIFPQVRARVPEAELHVYSRSTLYGESDSADRELFGDLYERAEAMEGVTLFEPLPQRDLAKRMMEAMVYVYPAHVNETFCISLLEAQAAGLVCVSSEFGAIPERICHGVDGYVISGSPLEAAYQKRFVNRVCQVLQSAPLRQNLASEAHARAHSETYHYGTVAMRMLESLRLLIASRAPERRWFDPRTLPATYRPTRMDGRPSEGVLGAAQMEALHASYCRILQLGEAAPPQAGRL